MKKNLKIGILGAGIEGIEAVNYFHSQDFKNITLYDLKTDLNIQLPNGVSFYGGIDYLEKASGAEIVFRSPGIQIGKLDFLRKKGIKVTSTTQYFMEHCPCKIIGVTGTKGKGTTCTLIELILKEAGYDVHLGGNIGKSPLSFLNQLNEKSIVILEMSSFQLQDLTISPSIAVVLRVTSDHLDYHIDNKEYFEAKSAIVRYQENENLAIFNHDYNYSDYYSKLTPAKKLGVSTQKKVTDGAYVQKNDIFYSKSGESEKIAQVDQVALLGRHHLENILPAICVVKQFHVANSAIQKVLTSFAGLPHRLELVQEINFVRYYNDSISTTPETSIAAVEAFSDPVILIAGGSDKGADYTEWAQQLLKAKNLRAIILIGQTADRMEKVLNKERKKMDNQKDFKKHFIEILRCDNLKNAVKLAQQKVIQKSVVVMSSGAASFDMFKNYKDRGEKFREYVEELGNFGYSDFSANMS